MDEPTSQENRTVFNRVGWIPDFSQPIVILRALLIAVAVAILLAILRSGSRGLDFSVFGPLALLSVWICSLSAVGLQALRKYGTRLPTWLGIGLALGWILFCAALCGIAPFWLGLSTSLLSDGNPVDMALEAALISGVVGIAVLRAFYAHYEMQEQQRRLLQAKYDALQARIRPHFLFNSLNTVAELIAIDPARAENAILDLSDLFRATLSDQGQVKISQELDLCEKYMGVEKLRMGERLSWKFDVDEEARSWLLPALSLQPLLENAVIHGVQPIPEGGLIKMNIKVVDDKLRVQITNPVPVKKVSSKRGTGTALKNIRARLETFCQAPIVFDAHQEGAQYLLNLVIPAMTPLRVSSDDSGRGSA